MAIKTFDLFFLMSLKGVGMVTEGLGAVTRKIEAVNVAAKGGAQLREFSGNLAMVGGGALAAARRSHCR